MYVWPRNFYEISLFRQYRYPAYETNSESSDSKFKTDKYKNYTEEAMASIVTESLKYKKKEVNRVQKVVEG